MVQATDPKERCRNTAKMLELSAAASVQAQEAASIRKQGRRLVRLPDYSLISGFIVPQSAKSAKAGNYDNPLTNIDAIGRTIFSMYDSIDAEKIGFTFALGFPTICELALSLQRRAQRMGQIATAIRKDSIIYTQLMKALEQSDPWQSPTGTLYSDIKDVLDALPSAIHTAALDRFQLMVRDKRIVGLGDVFRREDYTKVRSEMSQTANGLSALLMRYRKHNDREDRESFEIRNRVDALNFALGNAMKRVRRDTDLSFVTPLSSGVRGERYKQVLADRTYPVTTFITLKAVESVGAVQDSEKEAIGWLRAFGDAAAAASEYVGGVSDLTHLPKEEYRVVHDFFQRYGKLLGVNLGSAAPTKLVSSTLERITSQETAVELFEASKESTDNVLQDLTGINLAAPADELLADFDLAKYKSLKRALAPRRR